MSTTAVSVTTSATVLKAKNRDRIGLILDNQSSSTVWVGDDTSLTASTGIALYAKDKLIFDFEGGPSYQFAVRGDIYGIVSSGTADVRVFEVVDTRI